MSESAIIIALLLALFAGALIVAIWHLRRGTLDNFNVPGKNADLRHFEVSDRHRPAWFAGILVTLGLCALLSWTTQRDEQALAAERHAEFEAQIARLGCAPRTDADGPLIVLVIDSSADPHTAHPMRAQSCARVAERAWMWWDMRDAKPIFAAAK
jgi:hypothetical protein